MVGASFIWGSTCFALVVRVVRLSFDGIAVGLGDQFLVADDAHIKNSAIAQSFFLRFQREAQFLPRFVSTLEFHSLVAKRICISKLLQRGDRA